jgi:stage IV sporulation protein FB
LIRINKFFIPYMLLLIVLGFKGQLFIAFTIASAHEIVHYLTAVYFGFTGFDVEFLPVGTVLIIKELDEASVKEDFIISLSGPISNIILAGIFFYLYKKFNISTLYMLYMGNISIGLFNLLPAFPLDGGRILRDILNFKVNLKRANTLTVYIGFVIGVILMFYYITYFFLSSGNFSIGLIALFIMYSSYKEKERIVYLIMGDIIKKKYKFMKRGYLENRSVSIYFKNDLLTALSILDKNQYNLFTILDNDMNFIDIVYEQEIVEALKNYGNISIDEYLKEKIKGPHP